MECEGLIHHVRTYCRRNTKRLVCVTSDSMSGGDSSCGLCLLAGDDVVCSTGSKHSL